MRLNANTVIGRNCRIYEGHGLRAVAPVGLADSGSSRRRSRPQMPTAHPRAIASAHSGANRAALSVENLLRDP